MARCFHARGRALDARGAGRDPPEKPTASFKITHHISEVERDNYVSIRLIFRLFHTKQPHCMSRNIIFGSQTA